MRPSLASRKPETSYRNGCIVCLLSHGRMDMPRSCLAHGAVVLSRMIRTAPRWIFGRLWKTTIAEHAPLSSLPSQIGRRRGNFLGLSVMFLLQRTMHKAIQGEKLTEQDPGADGGQRPLRSRFRARLTQRRTGRRERAQASHSGDAGGSWGTRRHTSVQANSGLGSASSSSRGSS
jgi:hypothetical protein